MVITTFITHAVTESAVQVWDWVLLYDIKDFNVFEEDRYKMRIGCFIEVVLVAWLKLKGLFKM